MADPTDEQQEAFAALDAILTGLASRVEQLVAKRSDDVSERMGKVVAGLHKIRDVSKRLVLARDDELRTVKRAYESANSFNELLLKKLDELAAYANHKRGCDKRIPACACGLSALLRSMGSRPDPA